MPAQRAAVAIALAAMLAISLLAVLASGSGTPASVGAPAARLAPADSTGPCPGNPLPHGYAGTVSIVGSSFVPTGAANYSYDATVVSGVQGNPHQTETCVVDGGSTSVGPSGAFNFTILATPLRSCSPLPDGSEYCNLTSGPYVAVNLTPLDPNPAGYEPEVARNGTTFAITYYADLASVALTPAGPALTYSSEALDPLHADPASALGGASPVEPEFSWSLSGAGWTFAGPADGPSVNVTAAPGAALGNLTVVAKLASVTGELVTPPASVTLIAVPTTIASAGLNRTVIDVGQPVDVTLSGSGADGYSYSAALAPGLGEAALGVPCSTENASGGAVSLACATNLSYDRSGVAQPVLTLSNDASSASWTLPDLTVNPLPSLQFVTPSPSGYVGTTLAIALMAASGAGTAPYSEACLASGAGALTCQTTPGPSWTFDESYAAAGDYPALAWAIDGAGANASARALVRIAEPLSLALELPAVNASAGVALTLQADVSGGLLPLHYWWNATGLSSAFLTGTLDEDGTLNATLVPPAPGYLTVTLTVVDALASGASQSASLSVAVGLASAIVPSLYPPTESLRAGAPLPLSWQAVDAAGAPVRDFSSPAEIELAGAGDGPAVAGWVNASGLGPLASPVPGWFEVPASAWIAGALDVSIASPSAGALAIELTVATGLAEPSDTVNVTILPDIDHLRLFDPAVASLGPRASDTLWRVEDCFGNPASGAMITVTEALGGRVQAAEVPVIEEDAGLTAVWVNYSVPYDVAATITVTDGAGEALLPPIVFPSVTAAPIAFGLAVLGAAVTVAGSVGALSVRRARRGSDPAARDDEESALRRLAEGREDVLELVAREGPIDLAGLAAAWRPAPAPAELAEWVASLVTDGSLRATIGGDGRPWFSLGGPSDPGPRVTFDPAEYERAERRRAERDDEGEP
ncbi:MAG TPA: hypothetical protein VEL82_04020 [Thermoplasmata archaeon]|nr:hypothetical protein [Thermoplasmata archaeon]